MLELDSVASVTKLCGSSLALILTNVPLHEKSRIFSALSSHF